MPWGTLRHRRHLPPGASQVGRAAIFIYDGYPGGVGLSTRAYEILEDLVRRALSLTACPCEDDCPRASIPQVRSVISPGQEATLKIAALLLGIDPPELPAEELCIEASEPPTPPARRGGPGSTGSERKIGVLDLETCCSAADVGAGANATAWGCRWR